MSGTQQPGTGPARPPGPQRADPHCARQVPDTRQARPGPGGPDAVRRIDADVPGAVHAQLEAVLDERLRESELLDDCFARDVAERTAALTLRGGKRLRAQFLWWAARACGGPAEPDSPRAALRTAAAVELLQTCALVHDDVMDGSALRRGAPALHAEIAARYPRVRAGRAGALSFAQSTAVLAGDLALAWADDAFAASGAPEEQARRMRRIWRAMRCEMVAGQYLDLHAQALGSRSGARALRIAYLKSARYTVEHPLELGAVLGGADAHTAHALCGAGRAAGLAFQLRDDLLGAFGDPSRTGKPSGDDIRDGKPTYLAAIAAARAEGHRSRTAAGVLRRSLGDPHLCERELARVREVFVDTGARAVVEARIARLARQSRDHLDRPGLDPAARAALHRLVDAAAGEPPAAAPPPGRSLAPCGPHLPLAPQGARA